MNNKVIAIAACLIATPFYAQADAISELEAQYHSQGAASFSAASGKALWSKTFIDSKTGKERSCVTCHSADLTKQGKHARTGKMIEPMAPSVNPKRFTQVKKIKKWFVRNCNWTFGRKCTAQEKGDFLAFFKTI